MPDSVPLELRKSSAINSERCPSCRRNAVRHHSGITVRHGPERAPATILGRAEPALQYTGPLQRLTLSDSNCARVRCGMRRATGPSIMIMAFASYRTVGRELMPQFPMVHRDELALPRHNERPSDDRETQTSRRGGRVLCTHQTKNCCWNVSASNRWS